MHEKILIINNSLAALKFVYSIRKCRTDCVFYGLATEEDLGSTYIKYLEDFEILPSGDSSKNFCNLELILKAAKKFDVDFVWPGWGYLSENSILPKVLKENGIGFVGPSEEAIKRLGDKHSASKLCKKLEISHIPFLNINITNESIKDLEHDSGKVTEEEPKKLSMNMLQRFFKLDKSEQERIVERLGIKDLATGLKIDDLKNNMEILNGVINSSKREINVLSRDKNSGGQKNIDKFILSQEYTDFIEENNFPLLVKLSLSGGGKGIRVVNNQEDFLNIYETVKGEGSGEIILCKIVNNARHIELQMARDKLGNTICFGGRDCTIQRRHQKLLEESLILDENIFRELEKCGHKLMNEVEYEGVATVEFLVSGNSYYFLEVNTRIQVEHPVTEFKYKINIPEIQMIIANGESIKKVKYKKSSKHVMAIRIVAEDPWNGFLPVAGNYTVSYLNQPSIFAYFSSNHGTIGKYTDSQFGHVFVVGKTRKHCIKLMLEFISNLSVEGINNNIAFMGELLQTHFFRKQKYTIKTIENIMKGYLTQNIKDLEMIFDNIDSKLHLAINPPQPRSNPLKIQPFILFSVVYSTRCDEKYQELEFVHENLKYQVKIFVCSPNHVILKINDSYLKINYIQHGKRYFVKSNNATEVITLKMNDEICSINHKSGIYKFAFNMNKQNILAPTDGKIIKFFKKDGEHVEKNENIVEIEIMKMRLCVSSSYSGILRVIVNIDTFIKENDKIGFIENDVEYQVQNSEYRIPSVIMPENKPKDNKSFIFEGMVFEMPLLLNIFQGYQYPSQIFIALSNTQNLDVNILLEYVFRFYNHKNKDKQIEDFMYSILIVINRFFDLREDDYLLQRPLLELLELIDSVIIEKDLNLDLYDEFVKLKTKLGEYKFKKKNFFYEDKITRKLFDEYIKKNCCYKEGILFSLSHVKEYKKELIEKYLNDIIGKLYSEFIIHDDDYRKFSFKCNEKTISGIFYLCENQNCREVTYVEDLVLHYNCSTPTIPNHVYINVNQSAPYIKYSHADKNYNSDEIIHYLVKGTTFDESELIYKDIFRNLTIHLRNKEMAIIYKIDTHSQNSLMNVKDLSHAIKEILCGIIITKRKTAILKGFLKIIVEGKILIPSEYVTRITEDCMFYYSQNFIMNGILECEVIYTNDVENKIIYRIVRGFLEKLVYINDLLIEYAIENESLFSINDTPSNIINLIESSTPIESKERDFVRRNNTIHIEDFMYLFSLVFTRENYIYSIEELFLDETTDKLNIETYCYNDKIYLLSGNRRKIGMRGFVLNYNNNEFIMVMNDITYNNGAFSILEYIYYTLTIRKAKKRMIPFVFIACNSGAKIGLYDKLKAEFTYENGKFYHNHNDSSVLKKDNEIISICGNKDSGPENLSFSGLIASETAEAYEKILTLSYVTGRSVGIGAYLNKLGERIIQKRDASILLTGFQALNKLLQSNVYKSNIEIGGTGVMDINGNNHLTVDNDFSGAKEILRWLDYYFTSSKFSKGISKKSTVDANKDRVDIYLTKYDSNEYNETFNEREILEFILDRDSLQEYKIFYGANVIIGRGRIHGTSLGIISTESDSIKNGIYITKNVLFPASSDKIAQAIKDFSNESLDILLIANFKGFSGGKKEMEDNILKYGSEIVRSLSSCKTNVILYIPPYGQVRGGSWVVFDKNICKNIRILAHPNSEVGIMQPDGICNLKFKENERLNTFKRLNQSYLPENGFRMGVEFCRLHDNIVRMYINNMVDEIVCVYELRDAIYEILTKPV